MGLRMRKRYLKKLCGNGVRKRWRKIRPNLRQRYWLYRRKMIFFDRPEIQVEYQKIMLGTQQQKFTIIVPVYVNNEKYLLRMLDYYEEMPLKVKSLFKIILVDDCSPVAVRPLPYTLDISIYRIIDDIPWNIPGARNLGVMCCDTESFVFLDLDHYLPAQTIIALSFIQLKTRDVVVFKRYKEGKEYKIHPGTFFMRKSLFLALHGCDEEFAGHYGSDGHLRSCMAAYQCNIIISDLVEYTDSEIDGERQHGLKRDTGHNLNIMRQKNRAPLKNHSRRMLRFSWERVDC